MVSQQQALRTVDGSIILGQEAAQDMESEEKGAGHPKNTDMSTDTWLSRRNRGRLRTKRRGIAKSWTKRRGICVIDEASWHCRVVTVDKALGITVSWTTRGQSVVVLPCRVITMAIRVVATRKPLCIPYRPFV